MAVVDSVGRWLIPAFLPRFVQELQLDRAQANWLLMAPLVGGVVAALAIGVVVDRFWRPRILALGIALESAALALVALASDAFRLQVALVAVGAGSAWFMTTAFAVVMDAFSPRVRGRVFLLIFLATPLGAILTPWLANSFGRILPWQTAFIVPAGLGLALAMVALVLRAPMRGASEGVDPRRLKLHEDAGPIQADYVDLMVNSSCTYSVFGLSFASFGIAGVLAWAPSYLTLVSGAQNPILERAVSLVAIVSQSLGLGLGAWLADQARNATIRRLFLVPGLLLAAAAALMLATLQLQTERAILAGFGAILLLASVDIVPCFAILSRVTLPSLRGVGCGVAIAARLLAELLAPIAMELASDLFSHPDSMATPFGRVLASLGAFPRALPGFDSENLGAGLLVLIPIFLIAGAVLLAGIRHLPRECALMLAKLRAIPRQAGRSNRSNPPGR